MTWRALTRPAGSQSAPSPQPIGGRCAPSSGLDVSRNSGFAPLAVCIVFDIATYTVLDHQYYIGTTLRNLYSVKLLSLKEVFVRKSTATLPIIPLSAILPILPPNPSMPHCGPILPNPI